MKNYDNLMKNMTPEIMTERNVKLISIMDTGLFYLTSSGQLFNLSNYREAVEHEYRWLITDPDVSDSVDVEVEQEKNT